MCRVRERAFWWYGEAIAPPSRVLLITLSTLVSNGMLLPALPACARPRGGPGTHENTLRNESSPPSPFEPDLRDEHERRPFPKRREGPT